MIIIWWSLWSSTWSYLVQGRRTVWKCTIWTFLFASLAGPGGDRRRTKTSEFRTDSWINLMISTIFTRNYHYYYNHDDCHNHDYHKRREWKSWCQTVFSSKTSCWCENGGWGGESTDGISWRKIGTKENRMLRNIRWTWSSSSSSTWSSSFLQLASFFDLGADQNLQNQLNVKSSLDHKDLEETLTTIMRNMRNWMLWFFTITWLLLDIVQYITIQWNVI